MMKCLTEDECRKEFTSLGIDLEIGARNVATMCGAVPAVASFRTPLLASKQSALTNKIFDSYPPACKRWLMWVEAWDPDSTDEYSELWKTIRAYNGERRSPIEASGYAFDAHERGLARAFARLAVLSHWDAVLVSEPVSIVVEFGFDELIEIVSPWPVAIEALAVNLERVAERHWLPRS